MAFAMFFFLSLAFAKRYTKFVAIRAAPLEIAGRGYLPTDLELIRSIGPVCGHLSVLVLCLYINSPDVRPALPDPGGPLAALPGLLLLDLPDLVPRLPRATRR